MNTFDQQKFDVRLEWGERGVATLTPISDVVIIVDVLSFSTSVEIAVSRGAVVFPFPWRDSRAADFAASVDAVLAGKRNASGYSLSPASLTTVPNGTRIVLPSPNGAALSLAARPTPVIAGCLRNAQAAAHAASRLGRRIAVVAAGERWKDDGSLRPAVEDLIGAGAIVSGLAGVKSPEALAAEAVFRHAEAQIAYRLTACGSGKELIVQGFAGDVILASDLNASDCVPILIDQAYRPARERDLRDSPGRRMQPPNAPRDGR